MYIFTNHIAKPKLFILWSAIVSLIVLSSNTFAQFDSIPDLVPIEHEYKKGNPFLLPIWSPLYTLDGNNFLPGSEYVEATLYDPYNYKNPGWWDNIFEEMRHGGVHASLILTRAREKGAYPWKQLNEGFHDAVERNDVKKWMKFGQFEDCGSFKNHFKDKTGSLIIDWANKAVVDEYLWDLCVKQFRDFVPKEMWLRYEGRTITMFWGGTRECINAKGNIKAAVDRLRKRFKDRYGEEPLFILPTDWVSSKDYGDATIQVSNTLAVHPWFSVPNDTLKGCNFRVANDYTIGVCVPGFRKFVEDKSSPDYGKPREHHATFDRDHGNEFRNDISYMHKLKADFLICEAWVNQRESAGFYRSDFKKSWDYANQYINIFQETNDPLTKSRRFQFEACDFFKDNTSKNLGNKFSKSRSLDVDTLPNVGWYVGWIESGEWVQWKEPYFKDSLYNIYLKYASNRTDNRIVLQIGNKSDTIALPSTGGVNAFKGKMIFSKRRMSGKKDMKVTFLTPGISVDFLHFEQTDDKTSIGEAGYKIDGGGTVETKISLSTRVNKIVATFELADNADVELAVFNSRGQQVIKTLNKSLANGKNHLSVSHGLIPGIYYMNINIDNNQFTRMFVIGK